ncbi:hypothetical protein LMH87_000879 [Akanthomyces muscarius]|uniref:Uncharacterized protein n=1 Tax=Akanthomyces muscarius TaxID=2231603 RepID=A0A9W8ULI3_AKAMU|nr:hypothetical protein LMH87_000879 [Akanthomyces muscarius]KAJ4155643.1 hypothetical protein LMH87_000879 [Akanthomyces muscarius]
MFFARVMSKLIHFFIADCELYTTDLLTLVYNANQDRRGALMSPRLVLSRKSSVDCLGAWANKLRQGIYTRFLALARLQCGLRPSA